ncbi:glycosyltransferase family 1 protein [Duncaniella freteri]|jgi:glycosyltransferase involved in cell wall biosynthesis|uniref:Glycosyltransferase family 1 protein n=8 Tax=Duncaniella TaxID=2518495 RepID=A0A4Z0V6L0_9BACT|nr:glycosyltransferase family 1 protein [Duncaniella freteri]TGG39363.1 glycosyltransferase family 1 protein [Duncaniella freteri]
MITFVENFAEIIDWFCFDIISLIMNILYDYQTFLNQRFGGISRYFAELMTRLPDGFRFKNPVMLSSNVYLSSVPGMRLACMSVPHFLKRGRKAYKINRFLSRRALDGGKYDVFHPTYYDPYFLRNVKRPYVMTVYDMIHERFPEMFPEQDHTSELKRITVTKADKIIAISHWTKKDLIEIYGLPEDKIEVIHLGQSIDTTNEQPVEGLPESYILFVGNRGAYKNFERFARAFARIHRNHPDVKLVCTGGLFSESEMAFLKDLSIDSCIHHYFVSEAQLVYLYRHALCFVFPSLYEGFGIPILEAYAADCPLVLSNTSCFPEVAHDGGIYFDPYDVDSITEAIERVVTDVHLRSELVNKGRKVLDMYSWDKMAIETAKVYESLK